MPPKKATKTKAKTPQPVDEPVDKPGEPSVKADEHFIALYGIDSGGRTRFVDDRPDEASAAAQAVVIASKPFIAEVRTVKVPIDSLDQHRREHGYGI